MCIFGKFSFIYSGFLNCGSLELLVGFNFISGIGLVCVVLVIL